MYVYRGENMKISREKFLLLYPIFPTSSIPCVLTFLKKLSVSSNTLTKLVSCGSEWFPSFHYKHPPIRPYFRPN